MPHIDIKKGGRKIPSVTEILTVVDKPYLKFWYGRVGLKTALEISQLARDTGSKNHDLVLKAWRDKEKADILAYLTDTGIKIVDMEQHIISDRLSFHGCFDILASSRHAAFGVVDLKFTQNYDTLNRYQVAAYALGIEEMAGISVDWGLVVYADKESLAVHDAVKTYVDGKCFYLKNEHKIPFNLFKYKNGFKVMRKLYKELNGI